MKEIWGEEWEARQESERIQTGPPDMLNPRPISFYPHDGENRKTRRAAVANFVGPKNEGKGLRRRLLKQRQRDARGKLDVQTRRLQRKAKR